MSESRWVERLQEATDWTQPRRPCSWTQVESELSTALPADYKELCESFEVGHFSAYLSLLRGDDAEPVFSLLHAWRSLKQFAEDEKHGAYAAGSFSPYGVYRAAGNGQHSGLIEWGRTQPEGSLFWLADAERDPETWPVIARAEAIEPWQRFDMTSSEFVYHAITDGTLQNFSSQIEPPFYLPTWIEPRTREEWEQLLVNRPKPRDASSRHTS